MASSVLGFDSEGYQKYRAQLPERVIQDLNEINDASNYYAEFFPTIRDAVYDQYLKSQGLDDGLASYGQLIDLVSAWQILTQEHQGK